MPVARVVAEIADQPDHEQEARDYGQVAEHSLAVHRASAGGQSFPGGVSGLPAMLAWHARSGERMRTCHVTAYGLVDTSRSSAAGAVQKVNGWRTRVVPRPSAATHRIDHPLVSDRVVTIMAWSSYRE
ncbi:hypothetical protein NSERUTF1_7326 [Nocardia seriolae]|nr:hypothetical protein NSERUTF1_7326 [Nocardia seriolae]